MIKYRPEIDGLRAIAVVPVILFHAGVKLFGGGYVGVDVFFVISGYLITSIIYNEIIEQRFCLLEFYERRARRILPALLLITSISIVLAWFFLKPAALGKFANSVIGVAAFGSNIVFWLQQGYFEESTDFMPLIHTWSLGVEEQFYLLFPLLMLLLAKLRKPTQYIALFVLVAGSLGLSIWAVDYQNHKKIASGAFFLLPARAWELGIGALIAIQLKENNRQCSANWINNSIALLGIILIVSSMLILDNKSPFPGIAAIAPVVGTGMVIFCANESTWTGRILSIKPIVLVGLASYSLYLWHQILLAFWRNAHVQTDINVPSTAALILASSILSYLSFHFVEKPFRNRKFLDRKTVLTMSAISLIGIGAIGYATNLATQYHEDWLAFMLSKAKYVYSENMNERKFVRSRLKYELPEADAVIMGSSRLMQINSHTLGHPILNLSVSGASVEDYIAFVPDATKKVNASVVYLGADPWLFNAASGQNRWKSVDDLYFYWSGVISRGESLGAAQMYLESKSKEHDLSWVHSLYHAVNRTTITTENGNMESVAKISYDGFHIYDKLYAGKSQSDIERGFAELLNYSMEPYVDDETSRQRYTSLIHFLKESGVRVVIVLSPYHPDLFQRIKREKPEFLKVENEFRKIAANINIPIIGSYDGALAGCDVTEFYDGMHPKESCMKRIFSQPTGR